MNLPECPHDPGVICSNHDDGRCFARECSVKGGGADTPEAEMPASTGPKRTCLRDIRLSCEWTDCGDHRFCPVGVKAADAAVGARDELGPVRDPVSPGHYKRGRIEIMDFIVDQGWGEDNCKGNIIKYITRAGAKMGEDELTDLRKARWYLDKLIDITERKQ